MTIPTALPPLKALRVFEVAGRHQSFTRAAEELFVTHGAVSRQVRQLERFLKTTLFRRAGRQMLLTQEGREYWVVVSKCFAQLATGTERLATHRQQAVITVSVVPSFAVKWLVPRLPQFEAVRPDVEIHLNSSAELVDFESNEDVDLAIRYGRGEWPGLHVELLLSDQLFPVCAPELLAKYKDIVQAGELLELPLLHDEWHDTWLEYFRAAGLTTPLKRLPGARFGDSSAMIQAAIEGHGVALGRTSLVEADLAAGRLRKVLETTLSSEYAYYLVIPPRSIDHSALSAFRDWIKMQAGRA